ncbi:MAG: hypothetical protein ACRC33_22905 [Gemmataceae bacterium]
MLRLLRTFRPALEWLEYRMTPAAAVAAPVVPVDVSVRDAVFSGGDLAAGFSYLDAAPSDAVTDAVFATTFGPVGPTQFDFVPPPAPKALPPTPYGAGSAPLPVFDLPVYGTAPPEEEAAPDAEPAEPVEEMELVEA